MAGLNVPRVAHRDVSANRLYGFGRFNGSYALLILLAKSFSRRPAR
jgi:hypothetical protein